MQEKSRTTKVISCAEMRNSHEILLLLSHKMLNCTEMACNNDTNDKIPFLAILITQVKPLKNSCVKKLRVMSRTDPSEATQWAGSYLPGEPGHQ